jgi:hypothetical protein
MTARAKLNHRTIAVSDFAGSMAFYDAALAPQDLGPCITISRMPPSSLISMATASKLSSSNTCAIRDRMLTQQLLDGKRSATLARLGKG